MREKLRHFVDVVLHDPAVSTVVGFTGGGKRNGANMFISLKPRAQRQVTADAVIARLRGKLGHEPGANLYLQPWQDLRVGGRSSGAQYPDTLQADTITDLPAWEPRVPAMMGALPDRRDAKAGPPDKRLQSRPLSDHG